MNTVGSLVCMVLLNAYPLVTNTFYRGLFLLLTVVDPVKKKLPSKTGKTVVINNLVIRYIGGTAH